MAKKPKIINQRGRPTVKAMLVADRPTVRLRPSSYQPSKAELEGGMAIDMEPEQLAEAVLGIVTIQNEDDTDA